MRVPDGLTEAQVLDDIEKSVGILAASFVFGCWDLDDIKQEGRKFALQALAGGGYDPSRPFINFIYSHIRNRYVNLFRDKVRRSDAPCVRCHKGDFCTPYGFCMRYAIWKDRNDRKASIARPVGLVNPDERHHSEDVAGDVEFREMVRRIDAELPVELRDSYLKMRDGVSVPKATRLKVAAEIRIILGTKEGDHA